MTGILWVWTIFHLTQPIYSLNLPSCRAHRLTHHFDSPRLPNLPFAWVFDEILFEKKEVDQSTWICSLCPRTRKNDKKNTPIQKKRPPPRQRHVPQINNSMKNDSPKKRTKKRCNIKKILLNGQNYTSIYEIRRKMTWRVVFWYPRALKMSI